MIWWLILYLLIGVLSAELGTYSSMLTYPIVVLIWPFLWLLAILIAFKVFTL